MVTDDVWAQLDHSVARLPRKQLRRIRLALAALVIAAQLGVVAWLSGAIVPQLRWYRDGWTAAHVDDYAGFSYVIAIENSGWFPVTITGWGASQRGLEPQAGPSRPAGSIREPIETSRFTLQPGEARNIEVTYRITDCNAVTNDPAPLPVRVERFWGTLTVHLPLPSERPMELNLYWTKKACKQTD